MKEIKNILFIHRDDCSLNPLFEALLRQAVLSDSVLSTAGLQIDSADIEFPGANVIEGKQPLPEIQSALDSLGFQSPSYRSKNVKIHSHLIGWADLIFANSATEDLLFSFSHDAWNKTIPIHEFCGKEFEDYVFFSTGKAESKDDYLSIAATFKMLLPDMIGRIKDTYASHLLTKGRVWGNKLDKTNAATLVGNASVVRCGSDLLNFKMGNILIADRLGAVLQSDIDEDLAMSVIKKLVKSPEFYNDKESYDHDKLAEIQDRLDLFKAASLAKKDPGKVQISQGQPQKKVITPKAEKFFPDSSTAVVLVAKNAKAVVCSRGVGMVVFGVPYLYNCIGATEQIRDNQLIVVDSARGEVYDAATLKGA